MSTKRIKLVVAYDGTDFRGFAPQPGLRTVHGTLTEAIRQVSGEKCEIIGASRTDSGAHALGQVCHFDSNVAIEPGRWVYALNRVLPSDLSIVRASKAARDFDSRFCARSRIYQYRILMRARNPLRSRYAFYYGRPLVPWAMEQAARALVGRHDFRAFTAELDPNVENTVRELFRAEVRIAGDEVRFLVEGTAFLRGMMRRMAGLILEVGREHRDPGDAARLLAGEPVASPIVLPAGGLTLLRVTYDRPPRDHRLDQNDLHTTE